MCKCQLPRMIDPRPRPRRRSCSGAYCHQLGLSFCTQRRPGVCSNLLKNESLGFSAGNTSAQLVPRVFSLGSSSCCTLVTMLTINPLVHHVMKKASNCVCSTLCTFHSSILKKTGITCMAIIIQFHDGWKILFCTFGSSHYCSRVHTVAVTLFTHPIIIKLHCENVLLGARLSKIFSDGG